MHIELIEFTAHIAAAYLHDNVVAPSEISGVIIDIYDTLSGLGNPVAAKAELQSPAVPVKKSVTPDAIICLDCGKSVKMLKRHLRTEHSLTPDEYRAKWSLPADYPMTAPNYAEKRSELAKVNGLGRKAK